MYLNLFQKTNSTLATLQTNKNQNNLHQISLHNIKHPKKNLIVIQKIANKQIPPNNIKHNTNPQSRKAQTYNQKHKSIKYLI